MASKHQGFYMALPQYPLSDSDSDKDGTNNAQPDGVPDEIYRNGDVKKKLDEFNEGRSIPKKCRYLFVGSVFMCFLILFLFIWALPCSTKGTCVLQVSNWEVQHEGFEFTGKMSIVKSAYKTNLNVALFFKRSLLHADIHGGVINLLGHNGVIAWYIAQEQVPFQMNCYLLDANDDDIPDCLVLGHLGLEAVDSISGSVMWHARDNDRMFLRTLDFPLLLQDLNNDTTYDLLSVHNYLPFGSEFIIISGKTGIVIVKSSVKHCSETHIIGIESFNLTYKCTNFEHTGYFTIYFKDLMDELFHPTEGGIQGSWLEHYVPHDDSYVLSNRKLIINNVGSCPNCYTEISLLNQQVNNTIGWTYQNTYTFAPVPFSFKRTPSKVYHSERINGFIIKMWQWYEFKAGEPVRRHIYDSNNDTIRVNSIMERVALLTFNDTNFHVINISLTEITQLCFPDKYTECQPSLKNQNNSLLIGDLDLDKSNELLSYSSSFIPQKNFSCDWMLISTMKVIRIEDELRKLYPSLEKNP